MKLKKDCGIAASKLNPTRPEECLGRDRAASNQNQSTSHLKIDSR
jgi:hypothetical protein